MKLYVNKALTKRNIFIPIRASVMVGILTLLGFLLRSWKLGHGLPHFPYPDEASYIYVALNMGSGDLNPHYFIYPTLYFYLLFFFDVVYILLQMMSGVFSAAADAWELYRSDKTVFFLIGRALNMALGTLMIPVAFWIGKKMVSEKAGILASAFLAFSLLHLQFSKLATLDVPLAFFLSLSFLMSLLYLEEGRFRYLVLSGLLGGLAASTKYQGFPAFIWGPLACLLIAIRNRPLPVFPLFVKASLLFSVFFAAGFTLGTPYWILDFQQFKKDLLQIEATIRPFVGKGFLGYEGNWNWFYYLFGPLSYGLGIPLELAGIGGIFFLICRPKPKNVLFVSFPLIYFLIVGLAKMRSPRYMVPLLPFMCVSASFFLVAVISKILGERKRASVILTLAGLAVITPTFLSSIRYNYLRIFPETRELASIWVRENFSSPTKVLFSFYGVLHGFPLGTRRERLDPTYFDSRTGNVSSLKTLEEYRKEGFEYLVMDEWHRGRALMSGSDDPEYGEAVKRYQVFLNELEKTASLAASFSPYKGIAAQFDAENMDLESRSLWKRERRGPWVKIYKL